MILGSSKKAFDLQPFHVIYSPDTDNYVHERWLLKNLKMAKDKIAPQTFK